MSSYDSTTPLASDRIILADEVDNLANRVEEFAGWLIRHTETIEGRVDVDYEDDEYEIEVDLGQFGYASSTISVSGSTEAEVEVEADLEQIVDSESPESCRWLRDDVAGAMTEAAAMLRRSTSDPFGDLGEVESSREATTAQAVARLVANLMPGDDIRSVRRVLASAFMAADTAPTSAPLVERPDAVNGYDYDPRTVAQESVEFGSSIRVRDLRLGDDITGAAFGVIVAATVDRDDPAGSVELTLLRDGVERTARYALANSFFVNRALPATGFDRESYPSIAQVVGQ